MNKIEGLGRYFLTKCERLGRGHLFLWAILCGIPSSIWRFSLVVQQCTRRRLCFSPGRARQR